MKLKLSSSVIFIALFSSSVMASSINPINFGESISKIKTENICSFGDLAPSGISDQVIMCGDYKYNGNQYPLMVFGINGKAEKSVIIFNSDLANNGIEYISKLKGEVTYGSPLDDFGAVETQPNTKAMVELDNGAVVYTKSNSKDGYVSATLAFSSPKFLKELSNPNAQVAQKEHQSSQYKQDQAFLADMNGVWATLRATYKLKLNGNNPTMVTNSVKYPLEFKSIDHENNIVHLQAVIRNIVMMDIYLRKIYSDDGNTFFLSISIDDHAPIRMNFVRNL